MERWKRNSKLRWNKSNYRDLLICKLPRRSAKKVQQKLFSVEIIEKEESRVKVHYIGYSNKFDEWKDESEVKVTEEVLENNESSEETATAYRPFSLYDELRLKIKGILSCNRKASPIIKITMPSI